jgi:FecR protein
MRFYRLFALFLGFVGVASSGGAADALAQNTFRVASTTGVATWTNPADGKVAALKEGQMLAEGAAIITQDGASVVLVFASGATVTVGEKTDMVIRKFSQESFDASSTNTAVEEPSVSQTEIMLNRGTVTNKVAKLRAPSTYVVKTPVGAAGVRGTIFQVVYDPTEKVLRILTAEGLVVFTSLSNQETPVPGGTKIVINFEVSPEGVITLGDVIEGVLTPEEIAAIVKLVEALPPEVVLELLRPLGDNTILSDDRP